MTGRGKTHPKWCPNTGEPKRSYADKKKLQLLVSRQAKEMKLRRWYQPPEWPQGMGRVLSYTAWAYERGGGQYE